MSAWSFENRHVLAQVEILGVVETDMRPQGAVQAYGMACSVSHLRAMREAECRYGDKPVIIFEDDQAFLPNARTYLPQICLHLMKSNLWRGRMLMYLGRGQHSSQINQRVHALSVFQRLGPSHCGACKSDSGACQGTSPDTAQAVAQRICCSRNR